MSKIKRVKHSTIQRGVKPNLGSYVPYDLFSSFDALLGSKIVNAQLMEAEVTRTVENYLLLDIENENGEELRLIFIAAEVKRPCPNDAVMWEVDEFFTDDDLRARRNGQPFELMDFIEE